MLTGHSSQEGKGDNLDSGTNYKKIYQGDPKGFGKGRCQHRPDRRGYREWDKSDGGMERCELIDNFEALRQNEYGYEPIHPKEYRISIDYSF